MAKVGQPSRSRTCYEVDLLLKLDLMDDLLSEHKYNDFFILVYREGEIKKQPSRAAKILS